MPAKGQTMPTCKRGHVKAEVGTASNGWCLACRRESYRRRGLSPGRCPDARAIIFRNPICKNGHDKRVVGVSKSYGCKACLKERNDAAYWREWRKRKGRERARIDADPQPLTNLKAVRIGAGLTGGEMAERLGLNHWHYFMLEAGRKTPARSTMRKVVKGVAGLRENRPHGKYGRAMLALAEAERRGEPTARKAAEIMEIPTPSLVPTLLHGRKAGLWESYPEPEGTAVWCLSDEGRRRLGVS